MRTLSYSARRLRKDRLLETANQLNTIDLIIITIWGTIILLIRMSQKMPPRQRAALFAVSIIIGGALIIIAAKANVWAVALVIGILLGILIAELRHL